MEKDRLEKWRFSWRDPATGRTRRRTFTSESERDAFAATMRQVIERERQLKKQARQRSARISAQSLTVREIIQLYLELQITRPGTKKATAYHCRPLLAMFGTRKARMLTMQDVLAFREAQALRQVGLSTVRLRLGILRSALRWAVTTGRLAANPLDGMKLPRVRSRRALPPTAAEGRKMMEVAAPHIRRIIAIGMYCGPRIGPSELFRLRWADVDLDAAQLNMPSASKADGPDGRFVPLRGDLVALMRRWQDEDSAIGCPWVIHYHGRPVKSVGAAWHSARRAAGIQRRIVPYSLRHAFPTMALEHGADIGSLAEIMGHTSKSMILEHYQHVTAHLKRDAVQRLPSILPEE